MSYYTSLLSGEKPVQLETNYTLDIIEECNQSTIEIKNNADSSKVPVRKSLDAFLSEISEDIEKWNTYYIAYKSGTFYVKRSTGLGYYELNKYHLTQRAQNDSNLVNSLVNFAEKKYGGSNREEEEKYVPMLASIVYDDKDFMITDYNELEKFKAFYNRSKGILIDTIIKDLKSKSLFEKIKSPASTGLIISLLLTLILGLQSETIVSVILAFIEMGIFFGGAIANKIMEHLQNKKANTIIDSKVMSVINQSKKLQHLSHSKTISSSTLNKGDEKEYQDSFIEDIRKDIAKVNESKYVGYKEHLKILYRLAEYYLKAKNLNSDKTPYELFVTNDSLMSALVTIERCIEESINEHNKAKTSDEILAELSAMTGLSAEELMEETPEELSPLSANPSQEVEDSSSYEVVNNGDGTASLRLRKQRNQ